MKNVEKMTSHICWQITLVFNWVTLLVIEKYFLVWVLSHHYIVEGARHHAGAFEPPKTPAPQSGCNINRVPKLKSIFST